MFIVFIIIQTFVINYESTDQIVECMCVCIYWLSRKLVSIFFFVVFDYQLSFLSNHYYSTVYHFFLFHVFWFWFNLFLVIHIMFALCVCMYDCTNNTVMSVVRQKGKVYKMDAFATDLFV